MLTLESIRDVSKINSRIQEIRFDKFLEYLSMLEKSYEFEMNNEWQVRKELMTASNYLEREFPVRYIEYLISGGEEFKTFYLNLDKNRNRMDLIDGRRRILALIEYLNNRLLIFKKYTFNDFSEFDKSKLGEKIKFKVKISELKSNVEILSYYNFLNFYRENEIQNNLIFLDRLPELGIGEVQKAIEIGTGREIEYWEYKGSVLESIPIPNWVKKELMLSGEIYYRDNHWIEKGSNKEIKIGYYIKDNRNEIKVKNKDIFFQYYIEK